MRSLPIALLLFTASLCTTPPVSANPSLLAQEASASEVSGGLDRLERALASGDLEEIDSALGDLRRACFQLGLRQLDEATRQRVLALRLKAAQAGANFGTGQYWGLDQLEFGGSQKTFVQLAEDKAYLVDRVISNSEVDRASQELANYRKVLDKTEFQSDPALKAYFDQIATPELSSLLARLARLRLGNMENQYVWILDGIKQNNLVNVQVHAPRFKEMYYRLRHDGFDTSQLQISSNCNDPTASKISLDAALKGVNQAMLTLKALAAQEKARQAAYLQKWKTSLHGDKARIYAQEGIPTRFENCLPDYTAEAASRSSWWLYYRRNDNLWLWETTYRFNAQGSLVGTEKVRSFFPTR